MTSVQRSAPIDIRNARNSQHSSTSVSSLNRRRCIREPRERHDTITRIKSDINSRKRTFSNSLSPSLSSPTPPTFVPDGSHQATKLDNYLLVEHVGGHNTGNVYRSVDVNTEREYICKVSINQLFKILIFQSSFLRFTKPATTENILSHTQKFLCILILIILSI